MLNGENPCSKFTKLLVFLFFVFMGTFLSACGGGISTPSLFPKKLLVELREGGWQFPETPREILGPGSIVSITDYDGIRFRGHVKDCIPEVKGDEAEKNGYQVIGPKGTGMNGQLSKSYEMSAGVMLGFHKINFGPKYSTVGKIVLEMGNVQEEAVNEVKLFQWLERNFGALSGTCRRYLLGHNPQDAEDLKNKIFIIINTLRTIEYKYRFFDKSGVEIKFSEIPVNSILTLSGEGALKQTSESALSGNTPLYIGFKTAKIFSLDSVAGAATKVEGDSIIQRRLEILYK